VLRRGGKKLYMPLSEREREREGSLIRNFMQDLHLTVGDSSLTRKNDEKEEGGCLRAQPFSQISLQLHQYTFQSNYYY